MIDDTPRSKRDTKVLLLEGINDSAVETLLNAGYSRVERLAKALDVVGSRWTLLIVRELLIRGPSRYTDLRNGLPGIATNMLADRLRELEADGIVASELAPAPIATPSSGSLAIPTTGGPPRSLCSH